MASDPYGIVLALGLGFRRLSVPVSLLPLARAVIRRVDVSRATALASDALGLDSAGAVRQSAQRAFGPTLSSLWPDHDL